jgi:hypothetical protein
VIDFVAALIGIFDRSIGTVSVEQDEQKSTHRFYKILIRSTRWTQDHFIGQACW